MSQNDFWENLTTYSRWQTREVPVGSVIIGGNNPILIQSMTTTNTMDTVDTVKQSIRMIEAGCELVRITAPSRNEAENLGNIKKSLRTAGFNTPIIADIHFTPTAAEIAARIVEKVRVNPGNYADRKKFEQKEYSDAQYAEELDRIRERFLPLVQICKEYGTAMRIGTNHGSLSDRIMNRYGDTPLGMVESAMEFIRICENENYHNIVLSMKASNTQVMVQAYRLLVSTMKNENMAYPLHLGVTEAGDGEDGRVKSSVGIGSLLEDGLGDTIRVSLTEEPEAEIPVCKNLLKRYLFPISKIQNKIPSLKKLPYSPYEYERRETFAVNNIGGKHVPVVIADLSKMQNITKDDLDRIGYKYNAETDKWAIGDMAADYIYIGGQKLNFQLPGTLKVIVDPEIWKNSAETLTGEKKYFPIFSDNEYVKAEEKSDILNFVMVDCYNDAAQDNNIGYYENFANDPTVVFCLSSTNKNAMQSVRRMIIEMVERKINNPIILITDSNWQTADEHLIHYSTECGALLLDGLGDGISLGLSQESYASLAKNSKNADGRNYSSVSPEQFINNTAFTILQATRTRISKTEFISCPSCGRTLFDLQETTEKIRTRTGHLKGVKIAIMGCIVNGPGEMADADYGYVGTGEGVISLYKGKNMIQKNIPASEAVNALVELISVNGDWIEPKGVKTGEIK